MISYVPAVDPFFHFLFLMMILRCQILVDMFVQVAFKTGDFKQEVIFIGGLTDGLLATEYVDIVPYVCA